MIDWGKDYSAVEHPEWVGKYRELKQLVQETGEEGVEVFV